MNRTVFISTIILGICLLGIFLPTGMTFAQEAKSIKGVLRIPGPSYLQILTTQDGSTLMGRITEIKIDDIQFETDLGEITIPIAKIKEIKEIPESSIKDGIYWFPNSNATRLFFGPTGRCLKGGEGYFADYYLFFPMLALGVTDNITIAGGMSIVPWIGFGNNIFYFAPKIGFSASKNVALSLGTMLIKLPSFGSDDLPTLGVLYGVGTFGSPNLSLTTGLGFGYVDWSFSDNPMFIIGGEWRVSRNIAFVTENWILPEGVDPPISFGIRFFGEKLSVDIAFINFIGDNTLAFVGIPYVDFVVKF